MVKVGGSSFFKKDDSIGATGEVYHLITDYEYRSIPLEINPLSEKKKKALENLVELLEPIDSEVAKRAIHKAKKLLSGEVSEVKKSLMRTIYKVNIPCSRPLDSMSFIKDIDGFISGAYNMLGQQYEVYTSNENLKDFLVNNWVGVTWEEFNE